jgi:hypothetical protein
LKFEVFTAVRMMMLFFWVLEPCGLVGRGQRFGETYCLHIQGRILLDELSKNGKPRIGYWKSVIGEVLQQTVVV